MTTITLKINDKTKKGLLFVEFLKQYILSDKNIEVVSQPNSETLKAIENAEKGKTTRVKNSKDLFKELGI